MAAVVSGDGREVQGAGLSWCQDERPQEALEGEPGFMFSQSSTEQCKILSIKTQSKHMVQTE